MKYWLLSIASSLTLLAMTSLYAQDAVLPNDKDTPQAPDFASPVDPPTDIKIPKPATGTTTQPRVQQPTVSAPPLTPPPTVKQKKLAPRTVPIYE